MKLRSRNFTLNEAPRQLVNNTILPTVNFSPQVTSALAYPFPNLTKITEKPTPVTLKTFTKQVFINARAIQCHQAGGRYGHLGIVMPDAAYQALANVNAAWDSTDIPDLPTFNNTDDAVTIVNGMKTYRRDMSRVTTERQVKSNLKAQMLAAVESEFVSSLKDKTLGFANVSASTIYAHLMNTYGVVKPSNIEKNRARLSEP